MEKSAYIKLVEGSTQAKIDLQGVENLLRQYQEMLKKTGQQLDTDYTQWAFPYQMEKKNDGEHHWLQLTSKEPMKYKYILMGVGNEEVIVPAENEENANPQTITRSYIQVVLPDVAMQSDKGKANEFCKFMAKQLKAELHMFNGRILYYNPRK